MFKSKHRSSAAGDDNSPECFGYAAFQLVDERYWYFVQMLLSEHFTNSEYLEGVPMK